MRGYSISTINYTHVLPLCRRVSEGCNIRSSWLTLSFSLIGFRLAHQSPSPELASVRGSVREMACDLAPVEVIYAFQREQQLVLFLAPGLQRLLRNPSDIVHSAGPTASSSASV